MITGEQIIAELGNFEGAAEILQAWRDGMAPEPALLVSDWADKHRMLGSRGSAEPGPWRTNRTPYLRDVMDALSPAHPARRVVFMKGAQVGGPLALDMLSLEAIRRYFKDDEKRNVEA
jgi:phage terminase large subunit GpA-like protein